MSESKNETVERETAEIEITNCPDCGTQWEVVVTERSQPTRERGPREE